MLLGEFQVGKSTLFDYFCDGREFSEIGEGLHTTKACIMATGMKECSQDEYVGFYNKELQEQSLWSFMSVREHRGYTMRYCLQSPLLQELGYALLDCPGLGTAEGTHEPELLDRCIEDASLIVYVCSDGKELSQDVKDELSGRLKTKSVIPVVNLHRKSKKAYDHQVRRNIEAQVRACRPGLKVDVVCIHARLALRARQLQALHYWAFSPPFSSVLDQKKLENLEKRLREDVEDDWKMYAGYSQLPSSLSEVVNASGMPDLIRKIQSCYLTSKL